MGRSGAVDLHRLTWGVVGVVEAEGDVAWLRPLSVQNTRNKMSH